MPEKPILLRSCNDGQLGSLVMHEDSNGNPCQMVLLDRGKDKIYRPYHPNQWVEEKERPMSAMQVARICYDADRALRMALGESSLACKEWIGLKDEERIEFKSTGPKGQKRRKLYAYIQKALSDGS